MDKGESISWTCTLWPQVLSAGFKAAKSCTQPCLSVEQHSPTLTASGYLRAMVLKLELHWNALEGLFIYRLSHPWEFLVPEVWRGAQELAFLTSSQGTLQQLCGMCVGGVRHFENYCKYKANVYLNDAESVLQEGNCGYCPGKCHTFLLGTKECVFVIQLDFRVTGSTDSEPWW